ncbi:MAG: PAS domain S-box protein [Thermoguttaceae bacterium]
MSNRPGARKVLLRRAIRRWRRRLAMVLRRGRSKSDVGATVVSTRRDDQYGVVKLTRSLILLFGVFVVSLAIIATSAMMMTQAAIRSTGEALTDAKSYGMSQGHNERIESLLIQSGSDASQLIHQVFLTISFGALGFALVAVLAGVVGWRLLRRYALSLQQADMARHREVLEREKAERTLSASEIKYKALFDASADAILLRNADLQLIGANRAAVTLFGCKDESELAAHVPLGVSPERQPDGSLSLDKAKRMWGLALQNGSHSFEWLYRRHNGEEFFATVLLTAMRIDDKPFLQATVRDVTQQRRINEKLRTSERRLRLFAENIGDVIWTLDFDGQFTYLSPSVERMLGRVWREGSPYALADLMAPTSLVKTEEALAKCIADVDAGKRIEPATVQIELLHNDGSTRWGDVTVNGMYDELGRAIGLVGVCRDITEQKKVKEALRVSEAKYQTLYESSADAIMLLDTEDGFLSGNPSAIAMFGCRDEQEFASLSPIELSPDRQADGIPTTVKAREVVALALKNGSHFFEWTHRRKNGSEFIATVLLTRIELDGKNYLQATVRDITDQKRAEEALRWKTAFLEAQTNASPDGILVVDCDGKRILTNQRLVEMWRIPQAVLDNPDDMLLRQYYAGLVKNPEEVLKTIRHMYAHPEEMLHMETEYKDGRTVEVHTRPVRDDDGRYYGRIWTFCDITEYKRLTEQVQTNERRLRLYVENVTDVIWTMDFSGRFTYCSPSIERLSGFTAKEIMERCLTDVMPPAAAAVGQELLQSFVARINRGEQPEPVRLETELLRKNGLAISVEVNVGVMCDEKGVALGIVGVTRDETQKKRAETQLRESENRYRQLFEQNTDAILITEAETRQLIDCNVKAEQLTGYSREELLARRIDDLHPEGMRAETIQIVNDFIKNNSFSGLETQIVRKDGKVLPVSVSVGRVQIAGRSVLIGVFRDITIQKETEKERQLINQRMESLLSLSHMVDRPMQEIDAKVVEDAIQLTESAIGYLAIANDDGSELSLVYWSRLAQAGCSVVDRPLTFKTKDAGLWGEAVRQRKPMITNDYAAPNPLKRGLPEGHVPLVRHMNIPVFDGDRVVAVVGVGNKSTNYDDRDLRQLQLLMDGWWRIAMQRKYEQKLAAAKETADAANRAKSQFLAGMSHEIRTPMTAILGYADLLMEPSLTPSNRVNYATIIRRSGEHLLSLINDVLDVSKIEAGKMTLEMSRCNVVTLLTEVAGMLRPKAQQRGVSFQIEFPGPVPETIQTDAVRLRQTIVNLAGNAVKFTEQGSVRIVTSLLQNWRDGQPALRFEVIDTGIGIREESLPKLFQPFVQGEDSITQRFGGTGLGLVISRHIANLLGGELTVQSVFGEGSVFTLIVPTGSLEGVPLLEKPLEEEQKTASEPWRPTPESLRGVHILLAEDGFDNRELIQTVLRKAGADVWTAENGRLAVELARQESFDLILMDMNMPVMDGYEATRLLRSEGYKKPIFALTANAMTNDYEQCLAAGCDQYLAKPVSRAQLIDAIVTRVHRTGADMPAETPTAPSEERIISQFAEDSEIAEILPGFVGRLAGQLDAMRQSLASGQHDELRRLAHKLKGAGGSYGYPSLTEACAALEQAASAQTGETAALDVVAATIQAVQNGLRSNTAGAKP